MRHLDYSSGFGIMSLHAASRCRQRGIRSDVVNLIRAQFDRDHDAGAGSAAFSISGQRLAELRAEGVPASVIDQARRTVLIAAGDGAIVTVINRPTWFARFHRGADRLGHRRRRNRRTRRATSPR
jgi:hypothetical protein